MNQNTLFRTQTFSKEHHIHSICESIINDRHIYRWFLLLVTNKEIKQRNNLSTYQQLHATSLLQNTLHGFSIIYISSLLILKTTYLLPTALTPIIFCWLTYNKKKHIVKTIAQETLTKDFKPQHFDK